MAAVRPVRAAAALAVALSAAWLSAPAWPGASACPWHYAGGHPPEALREGLRVRLREICKAGHASHHSGVSAGPLWSAHRLTAARVAAAEAVPRSGSFHAEPSVPVRERASLDHYRGSGFDRGHLAPAGDMADDASMRDSFSLSNVVPQEPGLNRGPWSRIEAATRSLASEHGEAWVVTGVAFTEPEVRVVGGRVMVPDAVWKAVWTPSSGSVEVWWAANVSGSKPVRVDLDHIVEKAGIRPFPAMRGAIDPAVHAPSRRSWLAVLKEEVERWLR